MAWLRGRGQGAREFFRNVGGVALVLTAGLGWFVRAMGRRGVVERRNYARELDRSGLDSLPIVALLCVAIGVILAMQMAIQLQKLGAVVYIPAIVAVTMTRELGPLLASIILTGRVGAAIAAELGTMVVAEEIDALKTIGIPPSRFLVAPRLFALGVMVPTLSFVASAIGIFGGFLFCISFLAMTPEYFILRTLENISFQDLSSGFIKAFIFGQIFGGIACYEGFSVSGGAEGVGRATTQAVVRGIIGIILADAVATSIFYVFDA